METPVSATTHSEAISDIMDFLRNAWLSYNKDTAVLWETIISSAEECRRDLKTALLLLGSQSNTGFLCCQVTKWRRRPTRLQYFSKGITIRRNQPPMSMFNANLKKKKHTPAAETIHCIHHGLHIICYALDHVTSLCLPLPWSHLSM